MKTIIVLAMLLLLANCNKPQLYTGKIYTGKSYFYCGYDSLWIVADRFSSWNTIAVDTLVASPFHSSVQTDSGKILKTRCFISSPKGLQYFFHILTKMKLWVNTRSTFRFSYEDGRFHWPQLVSGECCVESEDSLTFGLADSLTMSMAKGSCVNIKASSDDSLLRISLVHGAAEFVGRYGKFKVSRAMLKPETEIIINGKNGVPYPRSFDTAQTISWRNAGYLLAGDSNLNEILQKVGNWYDQRIVVIDEAITASKTDKRLSIPCSTSLDSVLNRIETIFNVSTRRENESIFIYENPVPYRSGLMQ